MNTRDIRRKTPVTLLAASIGLVLSMPSAFAQDAAATPEPAGQAPGLGGLDLDREEPFEGSGQAQTLGVGAVQDGG